MWILYQFFQLYPWYKCPEIDSNSTFLKIYGVNFGMLKYAMQQLYHTIGILHWILFIDGTMIQFEINIGLWCGVLQENIRGHKSSLF
jgi:hypothetical protein